MVRGESDFFQKKMYNNRSFNRRRKTSHVWIWVIVIFLLLLLGLACLKLFSSVNNTDVEQNFEFSLGEEVFLQGEIIADGDIITHTHTIDDVNYGKIGIKSDLVNLSNYAGFVELTGILEKYYQGNPIVRVISISGNISDSVNVVLSGNADAYYMSKAGILFLPGFYEKYLPKNDGENGKFIVENIESGKEIEIKYFRCNAANPDRNCKGLTEIYKNNNVQSFVTSEGDVYYKNSDTEWFVANGERWGIYINNVSDDIVFELKDLIKFANKKNIDEWIKSRAASICQGSGEKMQKINNSEVTLKQEGLVVTVSGDGMEKQMTCQILVDFNLPEKGELQTVMIGDTVVISEDKQEEKDDSTGNTIEQPIYSTPSLDTNVPQFPIKEEGLVYPSSRGGYVLKFPSSNISYSVSSVKENFGRNDIKCSYVINVIKYSEKENLEISPSVRIYECDGSVSQSWAQGIIVYPRLDKKFIVQMNDGAWRDFSMNLKFEELVEE